MRRVVLVLVATMHKEALTLTDASLTKSDGSASLLLSHRIDFQSNPFLSQYFDNIIGDIFSHHYHREVSILTLPIPWMNDERMSAHFIQSIGGCIGLCNVQCTMYIVHPLQHQDFPESFALGPRKISWSLAMFTVQPNDTP